MVKPKKTNDVFENFDYIAINVEILKRKDLTLAEKLLLSEIAQLDRGEGCFASSAYLGKIFNVGERRINNMISKLRGRKLIANLELGSHDAGRISYAKGKRIPHQKTNKIRRRLRVSLDGKTIFTPNASNPDLTRVHSFNPVQDRKVLRG